MRLIDADALIEDIENAFWDGDLMAIFYIDSMPTIDAEPVRHGKWIKENIVLTSLPPKSRWHCSGCGSINDGYDESVLTPYCPNCGAKMDGDEISSVAKESADKIAEALNKVKAKGLQTQDVDKGEENV